MGFFTRKSTVSMFLLLNCITIYDVRSRPFIPVSLCFLEAGGGVVVVWADFIFRIKSGEEATSPKFYFLSLHA